MSAKRISKRKRAPTWGRAVIYEIVTASAADPKIKRAPTTIVADWKNKPTFRVKSAFNAVIPDAITVGYLVGGTDKAILIWTLLDKGTKRHPIRARNAKTLRFAWGGPGSYWAKTSPGGKSLTFGGPGVVTAGQVHHRQEVMHPGTEPREFYVYLGYTLFPGWKVLVRHSIARGMAMANSGKRYHAIGPASKVVRIR